MIPDQLQESVADRLKRSLKYADMSQAEMADALECHRNTVGGYVTGSARMMPVTLKAWAKITGVPVEWIKSGTWPEWETSYE